VTQFPDLYEYNRWANGLVLDATGQMTDEQRAAPMPELGGSVLELLDHTARVEQAFLALMTGGELPGRVARTYVQVREGFEASASGYAAALPGLEGRATDRFTVPWFEREFTIEQALFQVATHSVQHRAGICAGIYRAGLEAPGLDYIMWLNQFR
jgi:uncharacterized damage-inducible protein DinB